MTRPRSKHLLTYYVEGTCQQFEQAFGLSYDNATGLYLINSTHYDDLKSTKPEVTFTLADSLLGGESVNIMLPFDAFTLKAEYPFIPKNLPTGTRYFPLKKAVDSTQITLGRAFLQEA